MKSFADGIPHKGIVKIFGTSEVPEKPGNPQAPPVNFQPVESHSGSVVGHEKAFREEYENQYIARPIDRGEIREGDGHVIPVPRVK